MKSLVTGVLLWASLAGLASADLVISAEDVTLPFSTDPQTGSVEVYVQFTGSMPTLFGHETYVTLSPAASGISFTGVSKTVNHEYLFFPTGGQGGPQGTTDPSYVDVTDYDFAGFTLKNNAGLVKIDFSVVGGTTGTFDVLITNNPPDHPTTLTDNTGGTINYDTFVHGSITIIPEPSLIGLILSGALVAWAFVIHRRRK